MSARCAPRFGKWLGDAASPRRQVTVARRSLRRAVVSSLTTATESPTGRLRRAVIPHAKCPWSCMPMERSAQRHVHRIGKSASEAERFRVANFSARC